MTQRISEFTTTQRHKLRAVVIGAGSAGEGHTLAMRRAGVEVVAIASRKMASVQRAASMLDIAGTSTDWSECIATLRPDILCIATPADTHLQMIEAAAALKCHVFVDKPLAPTAAQARKAWEAISLAGVKSAYAATARYMPGALHARRLVGEGMIGDLLEAEFVSHYRWSPLLPYGWPHSLANGGGRLNNNFTHKLAIAEAVCGGVALAAAGETRNDLKQAPVAPFPPDMREWIRSPVPTEVAKKGEWGTVDSDWSYTALVRIGASGAQPSNAVSATFRHCCLRKAMVADYCAFYGTEGTIHVDGAYCQNAVHLWREGEDGFRTVPLPEDLKDHASVVPLRADWPATWTGTQSAWDALASAFVRDIQDEPGEPYFTIRDGWRHQEVIDAVRAASGWATLPVACAGDGAAPSATQFSHIAATGATDCNRL